MPTPAPDPWKSGAAIANHVTGMRSAPSREAFMSIVKKRGRSRLTFAAIAVAALVSLGLVGVASATASAAATSNATQAATANRAEPEPGVCAACAPPLLYRSGPVMGTATPAGTITVVPIYWTPTGYSFDALDPTYRTLVNRYISDIAAASNTTGNVYSVLPEYSSTSSTTGIKTNIKYSVAAGAPIVDTTAFPTTGQCTATPGNGFTACITDAQTQAEVRSVLAAKGLPADLAHMYPVFFPPNVQTQLAPGTLAYDQYCGYHNSSKTAGTLIYSNEPMPGGEGGCFPDSTPNNDVYADSAINILSHEFAEAFTDPTTGPGAWFDKNGNEIGDECAYNYGPQLGTVPNATYGPMAYNQVINGNKYYTQTEFSNAAYGATGIGTGCRQIAFTPPAALTRAARPDNTRPTVVTPANSSTGENTITLDASQSQLPADGTSTSTVTVTALNANGEPTVGDSMVLQVKDNDATPGTCGTLNVAAPPMPSGVTNADGQITATYTASTANASCYILATDTAQGQTDQTLLYQGTTAASAPTVTQTLPASLTAGGPVATFTVAANNPSASNIEDARFTVFLTGDATGATGLDASQVSLSYKDGNTNGLFVDVPLTGTTADNGEISGFVLPDANASLPAGTTRNATFQLSLTGGAPTSATTGSALRIETDLDQIDPADASETNLDFARPAGVPVIANPGDTITYTGKLATTVAPTATTTGSATLVANTCAFVSDGAACTLTGTATLTLTGGTLTGFVSTHKNSGIGERAVTFTETFTTTGTTGTGSGTAQVVYFDDGSTTNHSLTSTFTTAPTKVAKVVTEQGTITLAPSS